MNRAMPLNLPRLIALLIAIPAFTFTLTACRAQSTETESVFPEIYNSETVPGEPMTPEESLAALALPSGFSATLFAAEPDVQNPIATSIDERGRVWIAENYTYAERSMRFDMTLNDRVVVLEDTDQDGKSDRRTVFIDSVKMLTGITIGDGGVWLMCPPQLLFVPDADGDLVPDGPPQVKLDGFHVARENYHNFANGLSWGPDSWLYGRCGASCPGNLGLPGTVDEDRVPVQGGMWRYHPERQVVEVLTHGTTNPWGHDWTAEGELFFINTVNGHLWHAIPGAHFVRPHTLDTNPYSYELIDMHADHWHFDTGKSWTASRGGAANDFGGGHAHIGMMINHNQDWPEKYHGRLMTVNMHGRRINVERLSRHGAGYVGSHEDDFLLSSDEWFRGMEIAPSPDGSVILIDWSDTGECHDHTGVHRTSGRVFRLQYDKPSEDVAAMLAEAASDSSKLGEWATGQNEIAVRHARRMLRALYLSGVDVSDASRQLGVLLSNAAEPLTRLRALWALNAIDALSPRRLVQLLSDDDNEHVRTWAVRLLTEGWQLDHGNGNRLVEGGVQGESFAPSDKVVYFNLLKHCRTEQSGLVRLAIASTLCRLPHDLRPAMAIELMNYQQDADDHNLPLMVWYGLCPLGDEAGLKELADVFAGSRWSKTRRLIARRIADQMESLPEPMTRLLQHASTDETLAADAVIGASLGLAGRKKLPQPKGWQAVAYLLRNTTDVDVSKAVQNLSVLFGDGQTISDLVAMVRSGDEPLERRMVALRSLVDARAEGLKSLCLDLLKTRFLNTVAAHGLSQLPDEDIGAELVANYRRFHPSERPQVVSILTSRPAWAADLLRAVGDGQIDRDEISAFQARQIASHADPGTDKLLLANWGQVRASTDEKRKLIDSLRERLTPETLAKANKSSGRAIFVKSCAVCHKLYGEGASLGPDLTGAQRSNMDFLLENIVDPSAVVTAQFRATVLLLEDGRVLSGLLTNQTDRTLTLATQERTYSIPAKEVVEQKVSDSSTMPDSLLTQLSPQQIHDLFAYLQSTEQVPLNQ